MVASAVVRGHRLPHSPLPAASPIHNHIEEETDPEKDALIQFALSVATALHRECDSLASQRKAQPFSGELSTDLLDVKECLTNDSSLSTERVLRLLLDFERLVATVSTALYHCFLFLIANPSFRLQSAGQVRQPKKPFRQSSYSRLLTIINGKPEFARARIRALANDKTKIGDREKLRRTFKAFASVNLKRSAHQNSDFPKPVLQSIQVDDISQYLNNLYLLFHKSCHCLADGLDAGFTANVALDSIISPTKADDRLAMDLFLTHNAFSSDPLPGRWKEAQVRVFLEG